MLDNKISVQIHDCDELVALFNSLFVERVNTELVRGEDEPIYLPADRYHPHHRILFAHGFFASSLHEIAHWLVAGPERRLLEDFGYWYEPDGRSAEQQAAFEQVEVKPQALEWILARACGYRFRTSSDNLHGESGDAKLFQQQVYRQVGLYLSQGINDRSAILVEALCQAYAQPQPQFDDFCLQDL
ncbi:MAG: elongation factor P hydroxylase [Motiliproteus sp.]